MMENLAKGYYEICRWIARMALVNLLWVGFSLLGLGVLGFFPATTAMFGVVRKWVSGESEFSVFREFWDLFKVDFIRVNILGYILFGIGLILYVDLKYVQAQPGIFFTILNVLILILLFVFLIALLYIFPVYVHFKLNVKQYIKWSIVIALVHPVITVVIAIGATIAYYVTFIAVPGLMIFFGGSTIAFVVMWGASQTFSKFEFRKNYN